MTTRDIFQRELAGEVISLSDPEYPKIAALITEAQRVIAEMNTGYRDPAEVRALFSRLTGTAVDESFWLLPPFYTRLRQEHPRRQERVHQPRLRVHGSRRHHDRRRRADRPEGEPRHHQPSARSGDPSLHVLRADRHRERRVARRRGDGDARRDHRRERGGGGQRRGDERRAGQHRRRRHPGALSSGTSVRPGPSSTSADMRFMRPSFRCHAGPLRPGRSRSRCSAWRSPLPPARRTTEVGSASREQRDRHRIAGAGLACG